MDEVWNNAFGGSQLTTKQHNQVVKILRKRVKEIKHVIPREYKALEHVDLANAENQRMSSSLIRAIEIIRSSLSKEVVDKSVLDTTQKILFNIVDEGYQLTTAQLEQIQNSIAETTTLYKKIAGAKGTTISADKKRQGRAGLVLCEAITEVITWWRETINQPMEQRKNQVQMNRDRLIDFLRSK